MDNGLSHRPGNAPQAVVIVEALPASNDMEETAASIDSSLNSGDRATQESPASDPQDGFPAPIEEKVKKVVKGIGERLRQNSEDEGYEHFLAGLGLLPQGSETPSWKDKYNEYRKGLFKFMAGNDEAGDEPWIQDWIIRNLQTAREADLRDKKPNRDAVAFGKLASIIDFTKGRTTYFNDINQVPIQRRPPVEAVLDGFMTQLPDQDHVRWIHFPANNMFWVEALMKVIYERDSNEGNGMPSHDQIIMSTKYWSGRQNSDYAHRHHARFMRPACLKLPKDPDNSATDEKQTDMVFFMPYLHWESDVARLHTYYIMTDVEAQAVDGSQYTDEELLNLPCNVDEKLLRKYLRNSSPLHVRRTLDQAYYYTLQDTLVRDRDQVVLRYIKEHPPIGEINPPVLMVDQCWLWVLGDIVITCFPGCWVEEGVPNPEDPTDLLKKIVQDVQEKQTYKSISTSLDLAAIIMDHCAGNVVDASLEKRREHDQYHFLDWFRRSIRRVMAHQTELFESFCDDSAILQKTLKDIVQALSTLRSLGRVLDKFQSWEEIFEKLQGVSDDSADTKFFDMTHEITNLREIEDISDELHMIEDILNQQKNAMKMFENVVDTDPKSGALARKLVHSVEARMRTIDQFHRDTRHTYQWIMKLLDLKQKQININEARIARFQATISGKLATLAELANEQAVESGKQGTSIMLFTTVTILFLPLSSLASIFGLNAKELNGGNLSFGIVSAYLFPLSLLSVIIAFLLAFHNGVRQFFTLHVKIILAYIDRGIGLSMAMSEDRVRRLEQKLKEMQMNKQGSKVASSKELEQKLNTLIPADHGSKLEVVTETYQESTAGAESGEVDGSGKEGVWQRIRKRIGSPSVKSVKDDNP